MHSDKSRRRTETHASMDCSRAFLCFCRTPDSCSWQAFLSACPVCFLSSLGVRTTDSISAWHAVNEAGDTLKGGIWRKTGHFVSPFLTTPELLLRRSFVFNYYNQKAQSAFLNLLLGMNGVRGSVPGWNVLYALGSWPGKRRQKSST